MTPWPVLVRIEVMKATDTRAARGVFAAIALLGVGAVALSQASDASLETFVGGVGIPLTVLLPVVAVLAVTGDWNGRSALVTFTQTPRRLRVLTARLVAIVGLVLGVALVTATAAALAFVLLHPDLLAATDWWAVTAAAGGVVALAIAAAMTGTAVGSLLLNTPLAIVVTMLLPLTFDIAAALLVPTAAPWISTLAFAAWLAQPHLSWADGPGDIPGAGQALTSLLLWVVLPLGLGWWRQMLRDVS
jgi:hypothetical protein